MFEQVNQIAIKAWKSLPNKGEVSASLTKILQGPMEPFSDFVARLVEAAGRICGDPDAAIPLIKQLVFEQCTKKCRPVAAHSSIILFRQKRDFGITAAIVTAITVAASGLLCLLLLCPVQCKLPLS